MAYSAPSILSVGNILTAALWNVVANDIIYLQDREDNPPRVFAYHTATQSINTATDTVVTLNAEFADTASIHDTAVNPSRLTIPSGQGGWWLFAGRVEFAASATGQRTLMLRLGGATEMAATQVDAAAAGTTKLSIAFIWNAAAADYYELVARQSSGGALNLSANPYFLAQRIA